MTVKELMTELFHNGDIYVFRVEGCDGTTMYGVQDEYGDLVFEITQKNFNLIHESHPSEVVTTSECGCVYHIIKPNGVKETVVGTGFSLS